MKTTDDGVGFAPRRHAPRRLPQATEPCLRLVPLYLFNPPRPLKPLRPPRPLKPLRPVRPLLTAHNPTTTTPHKRTTSSPFPPCPCPTATTPLLLLSFASFLSFSSLSRACAPPERPPRPDDSPIGASSCARRGARRAPWSSPRANPHPDRPNKPETFEP